jgi:hypothetical protein
MDNSSDPRLAHQRYEGSAILKVDNREAHARRCVRRSPVSRDNRRALRCTPTHEPATDQPGRARNENWAAHHETAGAG